MLDQSPSQSRILVVDDEELNRDMLSRRLERHGYRVDVASGGGEALRLTESAPYDAVVLDVMMPQIDGVEVLRRLRERFLGTQLVVIMATAKDGREDIVQALQLGANDYVTKPLDFAVVLARLQTHLRLKHAVDRIVSMERELERRNAALREANGKMVRDLELAAKVQRSLLPSGPRSIGRADFAWAYEPCEHLAGDIFNVFPLGSTHAGFYLLDVSGHGVPAALLSVTLSRVLSPVPGGGSVVQRPRRNAASEELEPTPPAEVLTLLNQRFPMDPSSLQYFTLVYGVLDLVHGVAKVAAAGHPPPIVVSADGQARAVELAAMAIGWDDSSSFDEVTVQLAPGDRLVFYSDGLIEEANEQGRMFGWQRLASHLGAQRELALGESLQKAIEAVRAWCGKPFQDDISALALSWRPS